MKTLIISSSLSAKSSSFQLCKTVAAILSKKGVDVTLVDARTLELNHTYQNKTASMEELAIKIASADNYIFGMGVHNYSISDSLKTILDNCFNENSSGKFFGILCAAGGEKSYLATQNLTQICMNGWRMLQLPRIVYATNCEVNTSSVIDRLNLFVEEFSSIGSKLLS